jgi:hypothetical protein
MRMQFLLTFNFIIHHASFNWTTGLIAILAAIALLRLHQPLLAVLAGAATASALLAGLTSSLPM